MEISVIVPIYNVEQYIEKCLRSLFEQTKTDQVEFILVNDCTPDGSIEIVHRVISEYPDLVVKVLQHDVNKGVAATRQTGIDAAIGEYTIQIDSDDWCEPNMLEELYRAANNNDADIVCCDFYLTKINDEVIKTQNITTIDGLECARLCLSRKIHPGLWTKLIRRNLYTKHNIKINCGINMGEDLITSVRLFTFANKVIYIPQAFYHYIQYNTNSFCRSCSYSQHLDLLVDCPIFIETFFKNNNLLDKFKDDIIKIKLNSKFYALTCVSSKFRKQFVNCHPEVDQYIYTMKSISPVMRWGFIQASKDRLYILNTLGIIARLKKQLFRF